MGMNTLIDFLDKWASKRVMVVGDFMLDQYLYGNAERLSPDAPVPVLAVEREESIPGGSSNVCMCLKALRCEVLAVGVTGADDADTLLRRQLGKQGVNTEGLIADGGRPTTVKRSYIGLAQHRHPQKMFRADFETRESISVETGERILNYVKEHLHEADVICLEDYNKGVLTHQVCEGVIGLANERGIPVLVDPASIEDYSKYRGATAITPNRTEAEKATGLKSEGMDAIHVMAEQLRDALDLQATVLTLDRQGALLLEQGAEPKLVPTVARSVYDVTGAGDMVLAMLAAAVGNKADWTTAVMLANIAAGLEVEHFGVKPIPIEDVIVSVLQQSQTAQGKIRNVEQLGPELTAWRSQGKKVAFTNGCFDILHAGHVELLRGARAQGDLLVLAVNTDVSISSLKGPERPIVPQEDRAMVLSALDCVDYVIFFGDGSGGENDTPVPLIQQLKPDVLIKGGDYKKEDVVGWEIVEGYGGKVVTIPPVAGRSTTNIVERIKGSG